MGTGSRKDLPFRFPEASPPEPGSGASAYHLRLVLCYIFYRDTGLPVAVGG